MEALQATTGEQLPKVVVPRTCGYSTLAEVAGAMTLQLATIEAQHGWAHPSRGQHRWDWMGSYQM